MKSTKGIDDKRLDTLLSDAAAMRQALRVEERRCRAWECVSAKAGIGKPKPVWRTALRAAAVVLPIAFAALFFTQRGAAVDTLMQASTSAADTFALPDGSTVVLGEGSRLAFSNGDESRKARIEGIGLFMVSRDEARPFTVEAGEAEVRVLGTTFSVEHWPGEARVRTRVRQGHVSVTAEGESVSLLAGEEASLSDGKLVKMATATEMIEIGTRDMTFRSASLAQVLEELKTCYHGELKGVVMACADDSVLITTSFKDQTLESVVEELNMHFDKKLTLRNGYLTVSD